MAINLRGSGIIPDGSITEAKLANNAVSAAKIQTDAVVADKIAANAVIADKIAADAVTTAKIANDAVSPDKVSADLGIQHFLGYETELAHTGSVETSIAEFNFTKSSTATESWKSLGSAISLKSNAVSNTATIKIYIDTVLYVTDGTASTTPVFLEEDAIDISALSNGNHLVEVKLVNSEVTGVATISKLDIYLGKKAV